MRDGTGSLQKHRPFFPCCFSFSDMNKLNTTTLLLIYLFIHANCWVYGKFPVKFNVVSTYSVGFILAKFLLFYYYPVCTHYGLYFLFYFTNCRFNGEKCVHKISILIDPTAQKLSCIDKMVFFRSEIMNLSVKEEQQIS